MGKGEIFTALERGCGEDQPGGAVESAAEVGELGGESGGGLLLVGLYRVYSGWDFSDGVFWGEFGDEVDGGGASAADEGVEFRLH